MRKSCRLIGLPTRVVRGLFPCRAPHSSSSTPFHYIPVERSFSLPASLAPSELVSNRSNSRSAFAVQFVCSRFLASSRLHTMPATIVWFTSPNFATPPGFRNLSTLHSDSVLAALLHAAATFRLLLFRDFFLRSSRPFFRKALPPCRSLPKHKPTYAGHA